MIEPTPDQCSEQVIVENTADTVSFAVWHPQWGGHCSHALVVFDKFTNNDNDPGCFDVANFHDGEFPSGTPDRKHYCSAEQLVDFGLSVLEKQLAHQLDSTGNSVALDAAWVESTLARLQRLPRRD